MAMRLSGLMSGMDTDSIVQELVAVKQTKVDDVKKEQTKLEWKQEAWKELNSKIKKLYNGTLSNLRFQSSYAKKMTKVSDPNVAEVIAGDNAMDSVQTLRVDRLAHTGYLTGAEVSKADGGKCTSGTKLTGMGITAGSRIEITTNGKTTEIEVTEGMTLANFTSALNSAGVKANFDSKTQRLFIGASESGENADFTLTASNTDGTTALDKLGILVYDDDVFEKYQSYADLKNADGSYTEEYTKLVDAEVASRLKKQTARAESLTKSIEELDKKLEEARKAYDELHGEGAYDTLVADAATTKTGMEEQLKTLEEELEELKAQENPDADVLSAKTEELNQLKEKLSYVEGNISINESLTKAQADLAEAESYFTVDADGNKVASAKLQTEVETDFNTKITEAENILANKDSLQGSNATKIKGQDALIYLNGAEFTSSGNTFDINGLTITCNAETNGKEITLTTQNDTSGIYDMIKNFITEYSTLINEMDKLYGAEEAKGYEPLTDDEKYSMSEKEIEKWEEKIKESLLRKDSTLNKVSSAFKSIMSSGFEVDGETMYLSDFGIETLGYFEAADNERNAYHIDGDEDDEYVSTETNTLKAMISSDPDKVTDFFSQLTKSLYEKTTDLMASVKDYSSAYTVYDDKKMKSDYDDYTKKISDLEDKLTAYEDKWYAKFSAMETAMAKMQSNANAISGLIGM